MVDTLGSVGVITSSSIIYVFDWTMADAICSLFISCLIFLNVYPLLKSTSHVLLDQTPPHIVHVLKHNELADILGTIPGVVGFRLPHFWVCEPGRVIGTIHVQIAEKVPLTLHSHTSKGSIGEELITANHVSKKIISNNNAIEMKESFEHNNKSIISQSVIDNENGMMDKAKMKDSSFYNEQEILREVSSLLAKKWNISSNDLTVQIERQDYLDRIDPIHHSVYGEIVQVIPTQNRHV